MQLGHDDGPREPVIGLAERRSQQAATNEAAAGGAARARALWGNGAVYEVRTAEQNTSRLE